MISPFSRRLASCAVSVAAVVATPVVGSMPSSLEVGPLESTRHGPQVVEATATGFGSFTQADLPRAAAGSPSLAGQSSVPSKPVPPSAPPTQGGVVTVQVVGEGATPQEAFDDGLRRAVRQAAGAFVRTDTTVENDKIVQDRVLSHSRGFVESVKAEEAKCDGGVCRMRMTVAVRRDQVREVLKAPDATSVAVDGPTIAGRVKALLDQKASAEALVDALFEDWPANVLKAKVAEGPKVVAVPSSLKAPADHSYVEVKVDFEIDSARWVAWCKAAREVFEATAVRKGRVRWNGKRLSTPIEPSYGVGQSFVEAFSRQLSEVAASASNHACAADALREAFLQLDLFRQQTTGTKGSLKQGNTEVLPGLAVALHGRWGGDDLDLYLLPIEASEESQDLSGRFCEEIELRFPGFAERPRTACMLLTKDGKPAGRTALKPNKSGLAAAAPSGWGWQVILAPLAVGRPFRIDSVEPSPSTPRPILLLPGFVAWRFGSDPEVVSSRMTLVYGFFVRNDELRNLDRVKVEVAADG